MLQYNEEAFTYKSSLLGTVHHGFGTKLSGDGRNMKVIQSMLNASEVPYRTIAVPGQVHSVNIAVVGASNSSESIFKVPDTDALITKERGIVLTVVTADCVPILYSDPVAGIVGISHNGWKGTLHKLSKYVIQKMIEQGADHKNIRVVLGPSISGQCYAVDSQRANQFHKTFPETVVIMKDNQYSINLPEANKITLQETGLSDKQIDLSDDCTHCKNSQYFSYRRDGKILGEMISFILL